MFRFLIRLFLAIITFRVLVGLVRFASRIAARDPADRVGPGAGGGSGKPGEPGPPPVVDRASAIDVPFTEEPQEP